MESESQIREALEQQNIRWPSTHNRLLLSDFEDRWRRSLRGTLLRWDKGFPFLRDDFE